MKFREWLHQEEPVNEAFGITPISPAYGRDYKSMKDVQKDFDADKDFQTAMGQYINKSQLKDMGEKNVQVRFGKLRKLGILKIK